MHVPIYFGFAILLDSIFLNYLEKYQFSLPPKLFPRLKKKKKEDKYLNA